MQRRRLRRASATPSRAGSTLDYVLIVTAILPFVALSLPPSRRIVALVFELTCDLIASPFL